MNYYPQYIHVPTTAPVQRYFADPHVPVNSYGFGDFIQNGISKIGGAFGGTNGGFMKGITNAAGQFGIKAGMVNDAVTGLGSAVGSGLYKLGTGKFDRGVGVGRAINGIGSTLGGIVGKVNPLLGAAVSGVSGLLGGLANRIGGYKLNDATIAAINNDVNSLNNTRISDSSNDSIANQAAAQNWGGSFGLKDIGSWGWGRKGTVERKYNQLLSGMNSAQNYAAANYANAANNVSKNQMSNLLINSGAMGGFFDFGGNPWNHPGSGAIAYGIEQQQLNNQKQMLNQMQQNTYGLPMQQNTFCLGGGIPFACGGKMYADGGQLNTHGSDFTNGLMYIEAGGRHEENPYQGVPMGYDAQGTPNVVEEGEIIVPAKMLAQGGNMEQQGDFVVSNRTTISEELAAKYHLPSDMTHAEALEVLTEESRENPTDIIAQNTDKAIVQEIVRDQEMVKQREQQMQQMAQQQMMAQLPPEEQQAMMAQAQAQREMQGPAVDELATQEQQQEGLPVMQPQLGAFGGNLYGIGGPVNMYPGLPGMDSTMYIRKKPSGNRRNPAYTYNDVWRALMEPEILKWAKANITQGQSNDDRQRALDILNSLQRAWHDSGIGSLDLETQSMSDSPYLRELERIAQDEMSINGLISEEAFKKYYRNHVGAGDNPPTYKDRGLSGTNNQIRVAGIPGMQSVALNNYLRSVGVQPSLSDYDDAYTFENTLDWVPGEEYSYGLTNEPYNPGPADYDMTLEVVTDEGDTEEKKNDNDEGAEDDGLYPTWQREVPLWLGASAVLGDLFGITNNPDFSAYNMYRGLVNGSNGYMPTSYHPVAKQQVYKPYDPIMQNILNQANTGAARRMGAENSNGNGAMSNAFLLSLDRNANIANGQLGITGRQYNDQLLNEIMKNNFAMEADDAAHILQSDATNSQNWAYQKRMNAALMGDAIAAYQAAKDKSDAARALNLSNWAKSMHNYGTENWRFNQIKEDPTLLGYSNNRRGEVPYNNRQRASQTQSQPSQPTQSYGFFPTQSPNSKYQFDFGQDTYGFLNPRKVRPPYFGFYPFG